MSLVKYCLPISAVVLAAALAGALCLEIRRRRRKGKRTPFRFFFAAAAVAVYIAMLPVEAEKQGGGALSPLQCVQVVFFPLFSSMKVFSGGLDFEVIRGLARKGVGPELPVYEAYLTFLTVLCPFLSIGLILSFFRNLSAYASFILRRRRDAYVFSALDPRALALAQDIAAREPRAFIAFCGVRSGDTEAVGKARALGAACFSKDILSLRLGLHTSRRPLRLFALGEADDKNAQLGLSLLEKYFTRENAWLYVFSGQYESELMLANRIRGLSGPAGRNHIHVRRINEAQSVVYNELYRNGVETVFASAAPANVRGERQISAVIIGMGRCGGEMLRALPWYCQMDGFTLSIDAFSADPLAEDRFVALCPGLLSRDAAGGRVQGLSGCAIAIHPGLQPGTDAFCKALAALDDATYVFVDLESDEANIRAAVDLRMRFRRLGKAPVIRAVLRSAEKADALRNMENFRGEAYDIGFIGDLKSVYNRDAVFDSQLDELSLFIHMQWIGDDASDAVKAAQEREFRLYEYNYRSSMASAIHKTAYCKLHPLPTGEVNAQYAQAAGRLEHRRWSAYMLSEGFVSAAPEDGLQRDYIARRHADLVDYDKLDAQYHDETEKDMRIEAASLRYIWKRMRRGGAN